MYVFDAKGNRSGKELKRERRERNEVKNGKIRYRIIARRGLTIDDREITNFDHPDNRSPVCDKCKMVMEKIEGQLKWGCRRCYAVINFGEKFSKSRLSNQDIKEKNVEKFRKHSYTGRSAYFK